ncbi:hypothetical protein [Lacihabitans sp. CS3-21]|uniref:hypothetical protein n=1 Tax=Lacihabitans sp. CS3-21 TaxID=2487332 RepID=UPI0020CB741A|nr:hypothetical protein [Lacihabitans sp. CS3-21]
MTTIAEREELKKCLIELVESEFVNSLLNDVMKEIKRRKRDMEFDKLLEENFKEYEAVFRALA